MDWLIENAAVFISALIGVIGALVGVIITERIEGKRRYKEQIERAKPILINRMVSQVGSYNDIPNYLFVSEGESSKDIVGVFRNTDNGILFWDYIKTETKTYRPTNCNAVDKNTDFYIILRNLDEETFKTCTIYCHDIFGIQYYFSAHFHFESGVESRIAIDDSMPLPTNGED